MPRFLLMFIGLSLFMGCSDGFKKDEDQSNSKEVIERANEDITVPEVERGPTPSAEIIIPPQDPAAPPPPGAGYSPPDPGNKSRGTLYKGGSQGRDKPKDTGNLDEPKKRRGPKAECGNGKVEVLPQENAKCPYLLYGVSNDELYYISESMGNGTKIAKISGVRNVQDIDFDPWGNLYGVGQDLNNDNIVYFALDCLTGAASPFGPSGIVNTPASGAHISDIAISPQGTVYAYVVTNDPNNDTVGTINRTSGVFTSIGLTGLDAIAQKEGNGLGWAPLIDGQLYQADNVNLNTLNIMTGMGSKAYALKFPHSIKDDSPRINGLDYDFFHGPMYATIQTDTGSFVGTVDLGSGKVEFLDTPPKNFSPNNLTGIAVNRVYEECDGNTGLPQGTGCNDKCKIIETDCADYAGDPLVAVDNDGNGLANCEDPNCLHKACNDMNPCTVGETCIASGGDSVFCSGDSLPPDCITNPANDCIIDDCTPLSPDTYECSHEFKEEGALCDDNPNPDDVCLLGTCHITVGDPDTIDCVDTLKVIVSTEDGGCNDGNPCTADSCLKKRGFECIDNTSSNEEAELFPLPICGVCEYEALVDLVCLDETGAEGVCSIDRSDLTNNPYPICEITPLTVFVSSETYNGSIPEPVTLGVNISSLATADANCNRLATAAGLQGPLDTNFVAWLSTSTMNAIDRLTGGNTTLQKWFLVDGTTLIADGSDDLIDGTIHNPINVDENGVVGIDESVWTGTTSSGVYEGGSDSAFSCNMWTNDGVGSGGGSVGNSGLSDGNWTDTNTNNTCSTPNRIYCFEKPPAP